MKRQSAKALVLLSGGLDSILAVKLLLAQGIEVEGITFITNFCQPDLARKAAEQLKIPLREVDISEDFLAVLKKPKFGYGAGLNPCLDCHALMLKKAGEIMRQEGFDLVATGEVLAERPMSQHKQALKLLEKESDLEGYLLRPLSAKLLDQTIAEKTGLVEREKLMDISGRNRKRQMELAKKFGIKNYPSPAGGCALTQSGFVQRLKELSVQRPDFSVDDVELIKIGRHFFNNDGWIILGRNDEENKILRERQKAGDVIIELENEVGPTVLIKRKAVGPEKNVAQAKKLILDFAPKAKKLPSDDLKFKIEIR